MYCVGEINTFSLKDNHLQSVRKFIAQKKLMLKFSPVKLQFSLLFETVWKSWLEHILIKSSLKDIKELPVSGSLMFIDLPMGRDFSKWLTIIKQGF